MTPRSRGFVLVNALVLVAALAGIATFLLARAEGARARAHEAQGAAQARLYLDAFEALSIGILSSDRAALMLRIRNGALEDARELGLDLLDVRLKRTDLPAENLDATFARMRAEREREATDERARGNEAAQRVRAQADRTVVELTSDAARQAEIIRGEADARRNGIFAAAFGEDPEFFEFYRSLTAYQRALQEGNSTLVLSPDSDFFNYLKSDTGAQADRRRDTAAAPAAEAPAEEASEAAPADAPSPETTPAPEAPVDDSGDAAVTQ